MTYVNPKRCQAPISKHLVFLPRYSNKASSHLPRFNLNTLPKREPTKCKVSKMLI
jgi:hypothetical protein